MDDTPLVQVSFEPVRMATREALAPDATLIGTAPAERLIEHHRSVGLSHSPSDDRLSAITDVSADASPAHGDPMAESGATTATVMNLAQETHDEIEEVVPPAVVHHLLLTAASNDSDGRGDARSLSRSPSADPVTDAELRAAARRLIGGDHTSGRLSGLSAGSRASPSAFSDRPSVTRGAVVVAPPDADDDGGSDGGNDRNRPPRLRPVRPSVFKLLQWPKIGVAREAGALKTMAVSVETSEAIPVTPEKQLDEPWTVARDGYKPPPTNAALGVARPGTPAARGSRGDDDKSEAGDDDLDGSDDEGWIGADGKTQVRVGRSGVLADSRPCGVDGLVPLLVSPARPCTDCTHALPRWRLRDRVA